MEELVANISEVTKAINVLISTQQVKGEMAATLKNLQEYHSEAASSALSVTTGTEIIKFAAEKYESIINKLLMRKYLKP